MLISISLNNSTVLVLVNGKKFELTRTRTRTRNSNSTWFETQVGWDGLIPDKFDGIPRETHNTLSTKDPDCVKHNVSRRCTCRFREDSPQTLTQLSIIIIDSINARINEFSYTKIYLKSLS